MRFFADLHIHSRYSIACSRDLTPENLCRWAQLKGISVIGTGDFTHPLWLAELREKLQDVDGNLYTLRNDLHPSQVPPSCRGQVRFLLSGEISCIYKKAGRTRKVHALVMVPDFVAARHLTRLLAGVGSVTADGRPILKLDVKHLLEMVLEISSEAMLVPAHAWTPHFSLLGALSGFNSLEECFDELTPHIYALETGLSSDPAMNWRVPTLDHIRLISCSDAHSPAKLGREATIFDTQVTYAGIIGAIRTGSGLAGTVEYLPEKGKYHHDGHRPCGIRLTPRETIAHGFRCPGCGNKITMGVLHRVEQLADRPEGFVRTNAAPFYPVIPLQELIAETISMGAGCRRVQRIYDDLLAKLGTELDILLKAGREEIAGGSSERIAEAIDRVRAGSIRIEPGYDGKFGSIRILDGC